MCFQGSCVCAIVILQSIVKHNSWKCRKKPNQIWYYWSGWIKVLEQCFNTQHLNNHPFLVDQDPSKSQSQFTGKDFPFLCGLHAHHQSRWAVHIQDDKLPVVAHFQLGGTKKREQKNTPRNDADFSYYWMFCNVTSWGNHVSCQRSVLFQGRISWLIINLKDFWRPWKLTVCHFPSLSFGPPATLTSAFSLLICIRGMPSWRDKTNQSSPFLVSP